MTIILTGASGFLGAALVPLLENAGHALIAVERKAGLDILDWSKINALPACDRVIHLAAQSYVPDAYTHPRDFYETNVTGTLNMLELARVRQAGFIFISSYVYGHPKYLPIDEIHEIAAVNPYAQSKIMGEELCRAYHRDFGLDVTVFRPFNIYGIGQKDHFLLPKILKQAAEGGMITLFDPRPKRDYVEVRDVARAILAAVERPVSGYEVFNIGSGASYSIEEVVDLVRPCYPAPLKTEYLNNFRPDEILDTICDYSKARKLLNWKPEISLEDGLRQMASSL